MSQKIKRKIIIINPKFQWQYLAHSLVASLFFFTVLYFAMLFSFDYFEAEIYNYSSDLAVTTEELFIFLKSRMGMVFISAVLFSVFWVAVLGLFISHRIAGPIYRMQQHLIFLKNNPDSYSTVKFREKDYFIELESAFNEFIESRNPKK